MVTEDTKKELSDVVEKILSEKRINFNKDTSALEAEIDHLVYQLYDLTEEEIRIVEGKE